MRPRADEVLRSAIWSFDTYLLPEVHEPFAASIALTTGNLLRHVLARIEGEGQALFEDNAELCDVLRAVEAFAVKIGGGADGHLTAFPERIQAAITARHWPEDAYPSLDLVIERATALRAVLDDAIRALQSAVEMHEAPGYAALRLRIRQYLRQQLEREAAWATRPLVGERR